MPVVNKKTVTVQKKVPKIVLELSLHEAQVLQFLTGLILGCDENSPRKVTDDIYFVLSEILDVNTKYFSTEEQHAIRFDNYIVGGNSPDDKTEFV